MHVAWVSVKGLCPKFTKIQAVPDKQMAGRRHSRQILPFCISYCLAPQREQVVTGVPCEVTVWYVACPGVSSDQFGQKPPCGNRAPQSLHWLMYSIFSYVVVHACPRAGVPSVAPHTEQVLVPPAVQVAFLVTFHVCLVLAIFFVEATLPQNLHLVTIFPSFLHVALTVLFT